MDYKIFASENYNVSTLNRLEISDPLVGLKEFLVGKSSDQFKQHLRDLLFAVFEKHGWRQHGAPLNLYQKAKEVAKLMDFVWLITTCEIGTQYKDIDVKAYYLSEPYRRRTFGKLFTKTPTKNKPGVVPYVDMARAIFEERHGLLLKDDIERVWLQVALNSSYMPNLTIDFYVIESSTEIKEYWHMMTIIDAAFELVNAPAPLLDAGKLTYYELFASDTDHPDGLSEEDIELLDEGFGNVFFYVDEVKFPKAIRKWYALISKTGHWENHGDPGNVLFIKEEMQRMVETVWLWSRVGFRELNYFFGQHRLYEWKHLLDRWLMQSLSDEPCHDTEVTQQDCSDIIRLGQAVHLIDQWM